MTAIDVGSEMHVFQVAAADVGALIAGLGVRLNELSPLPAEASASGAGDITELLTDTDVRRAMEVLARPSLRMLYRSGGGMLDVAQSVACHVHGGDGRVVGIAPGPEGAHVVTTHASLDEYVAWWLDALAADVRDPFPNHLPPPLRFESLIYALHTIDAFRRAAYRSQLEYAPTDTLAIEVEEFRSSLRESLASHDLRWLLPSFVHLTPGIELSGFDAAGDHASVLEERGFMSAAQDDQGRSVLVFEEAGRSMGIAFARTWVASVGFEHTVLTQRGPQVLHRGFLAPTALANHLVLLDVAGGSDVNHQALTLAELGTRLADLLGEALSVDDASPDGVPSRAPAPTPARRMPAAAAVPVPAAPPAAPASAAPAFCRQCGTPGKPGAAFCGGCGAKAEAAPAAAAPPPANPAACPSCGAARLPGKAFCTGCGTRY